MAKSVLEKPASDFPRLVSALRRARGFALYFARCNVPSYRATLVDRLKQSAGRPIVEVELPPDGDPYGLLREAAREAAPDAVLFIYGLEKQLPSTDPPEAQATLSRLNWDRSAYQRLERPLVFWVPEYVVGLLAQGAPDFFDWNSGLYVFEVPHPIRDSAMLEAFDETADIANLDAGRRRERIVLLESLEEEYAGDEPAERRARANVAQRTSRIYLSQGNYGAARTAAERASGLFESLRDTSDLADALYILATIDLRQGDYAAAREKFERSLAIEQQIGNRGGEAATWHNLATIDVHQGDYASARGKFGRALATYQQIGDRGGEAATWHQLATIDVYQGDYAAAREKFERSLEIEQQIGNRAGEAATWHNLATIDLRQGDYAAAREKFERSLATHQQIGDVYGEAATFFQLGSLAATSGRPAEGVRLVALCYVIDRSIGHGDAESDLRALSEMASQLGRNQDQLDALLGEVAEEYRQDRGRGWLEAAFPES